MSSLLSWALTRIILLPAILVGLTFHEYAHGRVAYRLGDDTPEIEGRLTLNPLPHLDPVGFLMLFLAGFGWAKPVGVNPYKFKNIEMKKGMMLVSLAGPTMNFALALVSMIVYKLVWPYTDSGYGYYVLLLLQPFIWINLVLMIFNLIPVPPLDGSKILGGFLSDAGNQKLDSLQKYGMLILIVLIFPFSGQSLIGYVLTPLITVLINVLDVMTFFLGSLPG